MPQRLKRVSSFLLLLATIVILIAIVINFNNSDKKDIYRKELIISFLKNNDLIHNGDKGLVMVFFILNQCGSCTESFVSDFRSLKDIKELSSFEVQIIASEDTYEYVSSLDSIAKTNIQVYNYSFLEDNGFNIAENFLYVIDEEDKIKSFTWLNGVGFNELVNLLVDAI